MDIINLIIALISGAVGGNITGAAMKEKSLGGAGNTISGLIGGGLGDFILKALGILATTGATTAAGATGAAPTGAEFDIGNLLGTIVGSGAGGAILTAIIAYLKNGLNKS